jgi:hypothetical protein
MDDRMVLFSESYPNELSTSFRGELLNLRRIKAMSSGELLKSFLQGVRRWMRES